MATPPGRNCWVTGPNVGNAMVLDCGGNSDNGGPGGQIGKAPPDLAWAVSGNPD